MTAWKLDGAGVVRCLQAAGLLEGQHGVLDLAQISEVVTDVAQVSQGCLFIAYGGVRFDSHVHLKQALAAGACAVIYEDPAADIELDWRRVRVRSSRAAWAWLMAEGYGHPQRQLEIIGITGTNGKTSTAWIAWQLLRLMGHEALMLGTLGAYLGGEALPGLHTTPDPPQLFALMRRAVDAGIRLCVMEVSSHALAMAKVAPLDFAAVSFVSFSRDHLDYHDTMEAYLGCKLKLFEQVQPEGLKLAPWNLSCLEVLQAKHSDLTVLTQGEEPGFEAAWQQGQTSLRLYKDGACYEAALNFLPGYSSSNFALAALLAHAVSGAITPEHWPQVLAVPGRLEPVPGSARVLVDYAHTPDALVQALAGLRPLLEEGGQLWVVFGCGGNRDRGKRPLMAQAAAQGADRIVVTSDNPRDEDPTDIIADIMTGFSPSSQVDCLVNRREAIAFALRQRSDKDWLLIAGKGHETYQEVAGQRHDFDDRLVVQELQRGLREG